MTITNTELLQRLDETTQGYQQFVTNQLAWQLSVDPTVVITDPITGETRTLKTYTQIIEDYESLLGGNDARVQALETALDDLETRTASVETILADAESTIGGYVTGAESARDAAIAARDAAVVSEGNAASSEAAATSAASSAETADTNANASAVAASTSAGNAASSASAAAASETAASDSESTAVAAEALAQLWATQDFNVEVETGLYSAKHWAQQAQQNASGLSDTDGLAEGTNNLYHTVARAVAAIQGDASWNADDWDAAFAWGDHGAAGYLTAESDPTVPAAVKAITGTQISNWDAAFAWGDHASAGYLTTVTQSDVTQYEGSLTIAQSQVTGLNTALNGKASTSHTHTAADITSGVFNTFRIPNLDASKITSGTIGTARIPNLSATKITSGTLADARIPTLQKTKISGLETDLNGKLDRTAAGTNLGAMGSGDYLLGSGSSGFVWTAQPTTTRGIGIPYVTGFQALIVNTSASNKLDLNFASTGAGLLLPDGLTTAAIPAGIGNKVTVMRLPSGHWLVEGDLEANSGTTGLGTTYL